MFNVKRYLLRCSQTINLFHKKNSITFKIKYIFYIYIHWGTIEPWHWRNPAIPSKVPFAQLPDIGPKSFYRFLQTKRSSTNNFSFVTMNYFPKSVKIVWVFSVFCDKGRWIIDSTKRESDSLDFGSRKKLKLIDWTVFFCGRDYRHETCINRLRMRYIEFLEEQQARDERNHQLLGALDRVDSSLALMTAKTDRLGALRVSWEWPRESHIFFASIQPIIPSLNNFNLIAF